MSAIFWHIQLIVLHHVLHITLRVLKFCMPTNETVLTMSARDRWYYTSYFHGTIHAFFGIFAAFYGFVYADGQFGTTWFHCNFYKLQMFDVQKYLSMISIGWFLQDFIFCI